MLTHPTPAVKAKRAPPKSTNLDRVAAGVGRIEHIPVPEVFRCRSMALSDATRDLKAHQLRIYLALKAHQTRPRGERYAPPLIEVSVWDVANFAGVSERTAWRVMAELRAIGALAYVGNHTGGRGARNWYTLPWEIGGYATRVIENPVRKAARTVRAALDARTPINPTPHALEALKTELARRRPDLDARDLDTLDALDASQACAPPFETAPSADVSGRALKRFRSLKGATGGTRKACLKADNVDQDGARPETSADGAVSKGGAHACDASRRTSMRALRDQRVLAGGLLARKPGETMAEYARRTQENPVYAALAGLAGEIDNRIGGPLQSKTSQAKIRDIETETMRRVQRSMRHKHARTVPFSTLPAHMQSWLTELDLYCGFVSPWLLIFWFATEADAARPSSANGTERERLMRYVRNQEAANPIALLCALARRRTLELAGENPKTTFIQPKTRKWLEKTLKSADIPHTDWFLVRAILDETVTTGK